MNEVRYVGLDSGTVYGCVFAEVLSSGWRRPDLRMGIGVR